MKSATAAVILALALPGLGHLYAGEDGLGYLLIIATVVLLVLSVLFILPAPILLVVWLWGMLDAARAAERFNYGVT